jgi:hypothetical protein
MEHIVSSGADLGIWFFMSEGAKKKKIQLLLFSILVIFSRGGLAKQGIKKEWPYKDVISASSFLQIYFLMNCHFLQSQTCLAVSFQGPTLRFWYVFLDRAVKGTTAVATVKRVVLDQVSDKFTRLCMYFSHTPARIGHSTKWDKITSS